MEIIGHTLGFPRIGTHRELKYALENYWKGKINQTDLLKIGKILRKQNWKTQKEAGLDFIPVGDFAWYDHVLSTSLMLNNIPTRHQLYQNDTNLLDILFKISRGHSHNGMTIKPASMKKWFNTNYHYIVPEFIQFQKFQLNWMQLFDEIDEAISLQYKVKPILLGPLSYLWLGKIKGKQFDKLSLLPSLLLIYQEILNILSKKNIHWIQIDEPILILELSSTWMQAFLNVYQQLHNNKVKLLLTTYFDNVYHQLNIIKQFKIDGLHVDLTSSADNIPLLHEKLPKNWVLSAGVVNGKNIWKTNLHHWFKKLYPISKQRALWIGSSCSLLHSPIDITLEYELDEYKKSWFSFAVQKCSEIQMLCTALREKTQKNNVSENILIKYYTESNLQHHYNYAHNSHVEERLKTINNIPHNRRVPYKIRSKLQYNKLRLPLYPTTTIGSFPQTQEIRNLRRHFKNKKINEQYYSQKIKYYIKKIIMEQEDLDLDVLVHGEPERNDMVEYFGENLNGFIFTQNGWVQSYGSRCVKPPIIFGDISRPFPITVQWINYAQSLTNKPVKGILTGPITIMTWSFIREDIQRKQIALQLSLAIHDEVIDLEKSGVSIIQIDEPALREGLPLKQSQHKKYLEWAVHAFKLTISSVKNDTQIHTHMCYSEFDDIIHAIIALDTDVISIESSRSDTNSLLTTIKNLIHNNINSIGPGIYDIHSPHEPKKNEMVIKLRQLLKYVSKERLWINPDCGLKTRSWLETKLALSNMVSAAKLLRK